MVEDLIETVQRGDRGRGGAGDRLAASHLYVVLEGARPLAGGSRHRLDGLDEVAVGRGPRRFHERAGRRLTLALPDPEMSGAHARFVRDGDGWIVEDAASTNGTFVDGVRCSRAPLRDGAVIDLGSTVFVVSLGAPTPASAAVDVASADLPGREHGFASLVPDYEDALAAVATVAQSPVFVVLLGETGTGKEVLARGIHATSGRRGAFVPVNCGALPASLVESQLFGHVKGAFSGALRDEPGLVLSSDKGTLLLDEIGDLPAASQAALLRVLQEREVTPVGATRPVRVDLRVVAATHRPIAALTRSDGFRADLYARLAGYTHELRPLRDRKVDLGLLVAEILPRVVSAGADRLRIEIELARAALAYDWPLNVRELAQCLASTAVFANDGTLRLSHAHEALRSASFDRPARTATPRPDDGGGDADDAVRIALVASLERHRGNVSQVAREMGRTRMQVHRWMRRWRIDPAAYRA